jgi:hypothetical protein
MRANAKLKLGLILILVGLFVPIVILPFTSEYRPGADLLPNVQKIRLVLGKEKIPVFEPVAKKRGLVGLLEEYTYEEVPLNVGDTTFTFEFPDNMPESERKEILDSKLEGREPVVIEALNKELTGKDRLRFRWEVVPTTLAYRYPVVFGIILILLGGIFLVLSIGSGQKRTGR